jgi:4-diphosphocytidyl-2-C-methyl-D-erythritol kinase
VIAAAGPSPSATRYVERAAAKINLSLAVLGRRPDGYHELESLVAFADLADTLTLDLTRPPEVTSRGQFASAIEGANLVERALVAAESACLGIAVGHVTIDKVIPVAAGLGGGSADAAAALRLLAAANPGRFGSELLMDLALQLGSDVPVCVASTAAVMRGRGERLTNVAPRLGLPAVLVNPGLTPVPGKTGAVFARWRARGGRGNAAPSILDLDAIRSASGPAALIDLLAAHPNDLEPAARDVVPQIGEVLSALSGDPAAALTRLSGAGPTCFALCRTSEAAEAMADRIRRRHPHWWVVATTLGP